MRRRPNPDHQEAVSRRLELLRADLATVREPEAGPDEEWDEAGWTAPHTRISTRARPELYAVPDAVPDVDPGSADETAPPLVPVPGRHAARRRRRPFDDLVPDSLRGRAGIGPSQVAVLAVLVALGLGLTCWWVVRGRPHEVMAPVVASPAAALASLSAGPSAPDAGGAGSAVSASPVANGSSPGSTTGSVTVDVAGRVRHPGIAVLDAGSRVVDALKAAGGARPGVDLSALNLARVLVDGEQILVGVPGAPAAAAAPTAVPAPGAPGGALVDLNTAGETELEALPEVGPVTAQSIITWRDQHGGFSSVDELLEVDGIGDATLSKLAPLVTV